MTMEECGKSEDVEIKPKIENIHFDNKEYIESEDEDIDEDDVTNLFPSKKI